MDEGMALLVDGDQVPPGGLVALLDRLGRDGKVTERVCVRNWRSSKDLKEWQAFAQAHGFQLIQRDPVATGKNASDIELAVIAMDLLHRGTRRFCLVSGDTDFSPLVSRLRRADAHVEWVHPADIKGAAPKAGRAPRGRGRQAASRKPAAAPAAVQAKAPKPAKAPEAPRTRRGRRGGRDKGGNAAEKAQQAAFAKHVRKAIDRLTKQGSHDRGWVAVSRLGSLLAQDGLKREDFGFAKSRPMHRVLEELEFKVQQTETGAYEIKVA